MDSILYIGFGGFLGANARYFFSLWTNGILAPRLGDFPFGTLFVNVLGSFGLALFGVWFSARTGMSPQLRLLVGTGFFGAFTTFSTFANESMTLLEDRTAGLLLLNILLNNGLCLLGVGLGVLVGNRLFAAG